MTQTDLPDFADATMPNRLLAECPAHAATPVASLKDLAAQLGWAALHVKDETDRMGLGSFKALGGAYAVLCLVRDRLRTHLDKEPTSEQILAAKAAGQLDGMAVCCASAGNHGLSVAAGAAIFGTACEVFLAQSVPESFADRLRAKGATVVRAGLVYEDAMAAAVARSKDQGVTLVSDASWEGELHVPSLVMQGYAVMAEEICETFRAKDAWPTHVALQAGVGGIAASVTLHIRRNWDVQPEIIIVEPDRAACLSQSVTAGHPVRADGAVSNMGRLDCKEASLRAFETLRTQADHFLTIKDAQAELAVEMLGRHSVQTSPSGAAGLAGMIDHAPGAQARVLILATEGEIA